MTWEEMVDKLVGCRKFKEGKYLSQEVFTRDELVELLSCLKGLTNEQYGNLYNVFIEGQEKAIREGNVC